MVLLGLFFNTKGVFMLKYVVLFLMFSLSAFGSYAPNAVTAKGTKNADLQSVFFGAAAGCSTACTTGTCFICNQVGTKITSVTWQATGTYRINGIDGTKYNCNGTGVGGAYYAIYQNRPGSSSTYAEMIAGTTTAQNTAYASIHCIGKP